MANSLTHALPYPILNARYTLPLTFRIADGTPTDPTTPDTKFSIDGGATYADCLEEVTTGGSNGGGYLTLTGAETNNKLVHIAAKSANCKTTPGLIHPRNLALVGSGTLSAGSAAGGTLGTLLAYDVTNCFIRTTGGTGGGGTGGANNQARRILTYNVATGAFTVSAWETTVDATTTYDVLLPEGVTLGMLRTLNPTTPGAKLDVSATGEAGVDWANVGTPSSTVVLSGTTLGVLSAYTGNTPQTGDVYALANGSSGFVAIYNYLTTNLGLLGASLSGIPKTGFKLASDGLALITAWTVNLTGNITGTVSGNAPAATALSTVNWTAARAGYLDNLNVGGPVSSQADVQAVNQSASKHLIIQTTGQYERPETSTFPYEVELRTFNAATGAAVNADSTPTITPIGNVSGNLSANLSALTNIATGVYRATYTVSSTDPVPEQIRFDGAATIGGSAFTIACYSQVLDLASVNWTSTDATHLTAVFNKLPVNNIADETLVLSAIAALNNLSSAGAQAAAAAALLAYTAAKTSDIPTAANNATATAGQITTDHGAGSYVRNTEPPTAADNATATAAQITTDHGSGSYIRNTEPPTAADNATAVAAQITTDHGNGSYLRNTEPPAVGAIAAQITTDHGSGSYARNTEPPTASDNATAVATQITTDHGSGSYVRNTEPPATATIAAATAAQITTDHGNGSYVRNTEPPSVGDIAAQITIDHGNGSYVDTGNPGTPTFPDVPTVDEIQAGLATEDGQAAIFALAVRNQKLLEADIQIDTDVTPWAAVWLENGTGPVGTGVELLRQPLRDINGNPVTSQNTVIGQAGIS